MSSGVTIAGEVAAGLAAGDQVDRLGARLGRVLVRQHACASIRASSHDGPSGSAAWTTIVRDGGGRSAPGSSAAPVPRSPAGGR